jgi:hypothetical protein
MRKACEYDFPCEGTCDFCYDPCRCNASLDAAWAEAEAALPEGYRLGCQQRELDCEAYAVGPAGVPLVPIGFGPTPAAALRDLAVKLREVKS